MFRVLEGRQIKLSNLFMHPITHVHPRNYVRRYHRPRHLPIGKSNKHALMFLPFVSSPMFVQVSCFLYGFQQNMKYC